MNEKVKGYVATIGNYDGLHLGHREILSIVKEKAQTVGSESLVITFEPHPSAILYPSRGLLRIASSKKKIELLKEFGIDQVKVIPFTLEFSEKGPKTFVEEILLPLNIKELYIGHDFSFGSGRTGNVKTLKKEGELLGFKVIEVKEVTTNGQAVRSSAIRKLIIDGKVDCVADLLNRFHSLAGKVVKGAGRGRKLNFPTANLSEMEEIIPSAGVYATLTKWNGKVFYSATHVGVIPTFDVDIPGIETHLFDFDKDITGEMIEVLFVKKIRETVKFVSPKELEEQIRLDCINAREVLASDQTKNYLPR